MDHWCPTSRSFVRYKRSNSSKLRSGCSNQYRSKMSINRKVQVLFVLFSFLAAVVRPQEDYCNPDLCESGVSNIGCGATNELSSDCVDAKKYTFDDKLKKILLEEHNKYRNQVAKGELDWLPKAANMVTMVSFADCFSKGSLRY